MPVFTDTHAHIYQPPFREDIREVLSRAITAGVKKIILPNIDIESMERVLQLSRQFPHICLPTVGLHPCDVKADFEEVLDIMHERIIDPSIFPEGKIYGIGETGLDYYWDTTFKEEQKQALRIQIEWAQQTKLPIILHTRNSVQDTIDIVQEMHRGSLRGVFHCFSGNLEEAKAIVAMDDFYLGIGGTLTYKNSHLPEILPQLPLERIVLETDAPYLSPVPHRGKRNESSYIPFVAEKLAELYGKTIEEIAAITTENAMRLFQFEMEK